MLPMYADDRVLVAVVASQRDWNLVQEKGWYRIPVKRAPEPVPDVDWLAFYFTSVFGEDKWAIHYYARVLGHELVTRRDLVPDQPSHPRASHWYYRLQLEQIQHKLPPIVSDKWRRITFILTSGDRFAHAVEIRDLFETETPSGVPYVTLKEDKRDA